jgi:outer membrane lipoprotein-sorting protein
LLRIIPSFLLFLCLGARTRAESASTPIPASPKAAKAEAPTAALDSETRIVLKAVSERYKKLGNWQATFTQETYSVGLGQGGFNEGRFHYVAPASFRYSIIRPEASDFITDGKQAWQVIYRKGRGKAAYVRQFADVRKMDLTRYMFLLRGIGAYSPAKEKALLKDFALKGTAKEGALALEITPKRSEEISKIVLNFEKNSLAPGRAILTDALGNKTTLVIMSFESITKIDPKLFAPDYPPDSEVEKL